MIRVQNPSICLRMCMRVDLWLCAPFVVPFQCFMSPGGPHTTNTKGSQSGSVSCIFFIVLSVDSLQSKIPNTIHLLFPWHHHLNNKFIRNNNTKWLYGFVTSASLIFQMFLQCLKVLKQGTWPHVRRHKTCICETSEKEKKSPVTEFLFTEISFGYQLINLSASLFLVNNSFCLFFIKINIWAHDWTWTND